METGTEVKGAKRISFSEVAPQDIHNSLAVGDLVRDGALGNLYQKLTGL